MQLTVAVFSIALLFCSSHCQSFDGAPPPRPNEGVRFYSGLINQIIPNYGMISQSVFRQNDYGLGFGDKNDIGENDGLNDGLWCQSALNKSNIGTWKLPNGTFLHNTIYTPGYNVYQVFAEGQTGLLRPQPLTSNPSYHMEGVYECVIPDEDEIPQTLVLWIAGDDAYEAITAFTINNNVTFNLPSQPRDADPPKFTLQFTVNKAPPTYVTCNVGSQEVEVTDLDRQPTNRIYGTPVTFSTTATLAPYPRKTGYYRCTVSVDRNNGGAPGSYPLDNVETTPVHVSVPETPKNLMFTRTGYDTVYFNWEASSPPITGYEIFYAESGIDTSQSGGTTTTNSTSVDELELDITYKFYVVAYHDAPNTLPSERCSSVTVPMPVPNLPPPLEATCTDNSITVSWTAPEFLPTRYQLVGDCKRPCDQGLLVPNVPTPHPENTSATITGLYPGIECRISLTAWYGETKCDTIEVTKEIMYRHVPFSPPRNFRVLDTTRTSKYLCWSEVPCEESNGTIIEYEIKYVTGSDKRNVTIPANQGEKYNLTGLSECTAYTLSISAANDIGSSRPTPGMTCCTDCSGAVTGTPKNLMAVRAGYNVVNLFWEFPDREFPPVTHFQVFYYVNGSEIILSGGNTTDNTHEISTGLELGNVYIFFVVAYSNKPPCIAPPSEPSNTASAPLKCPLLLPPLTATSDSNSINISWTLPEFTPTQYLLEAKCKNACSDTIYDHPVKTPKKRDTSAIISGLDQGTKCDIFLTAWYGEDMCGTINTTMNITITEGPTAAPENFKVIATTSTSMDLCWREVPCEKANGNITHYIIKYSNCSGDYNVTVGISEVQQHSLNDCDKKYTLQDLYGCSVYTLSIAAGNAFGISPFSSPKIENYTDCTGLETRVQFQLKFGRVKDCFKWTLDEAKIMERDLKAAIVARITKHCGCNFGHSCTFDENSIMNGTFSCYGSCDEVTYRSTMIGRIKSAPDHPDAYLTHLEQWAMSGNATFVSQLRRMWFHTQCSVFINSFVDSECEPNQVPPCCNKCSCSED